jgi:hypothetical protein
MTNNQTFVAEYTICVEFKVPEGVNLKDSKVVKEYFLQEDKLYIYYVDGGEEIINGVVCDLPTHADEERILDENGEEVEDNDSDSD